MLQIAHCSRLCQLKNVIQVSSVLASNNSFLGIWRFLVRGYLTSSMFLASFLNDASPAHKSYGHKRLLVIRLCDSTKCYTSLTVTWKSCSLPRWKRLNNLHEATLVTCRLALIVAADSICGHQCCSISYLHDVLLLIVLLICLLVF